MPKSPEHVVELSKHRRYPLDDHYEPICSICGSLASPMDLDAAKSKRAGHARFVASVDAGDGGAL